MVILFPRAGTALTFIPAVTGQRLITSVIDHFGFLVTLVKGINLMRVIGAALITIGVILFVNINIGRESARLSVLDD